MRGLLWYFDGVCLRDGVSDRIGNDGNSLDLRMSSLICILLFEGAQKELAVNG